MPGLWSGVRVSLIASVFCAFYAAAEAQTATLTIINNGIVTGAVGVQGTNGNVCNPNPGGGPGGGTCVFTYPVNTPLRIAANSPNPDAGFLHDGTEDAAACALSTCNIVLTRDSAITATFNAAQGPVGSITTTLLGDGKGNVYFDNGTCQNFELGYTACTTYYAVGSEAKFQGQSMPGNIFAAFSGGTGGASGCAASPCIFTVTAGTSAVSATFSAMVSAAVTPGATTIGVGQIQMFSALATFSNGMTRYGFNGNTPWQSHTQTDTKRFSLAAAVVDDGLYAIGGVAGTCPSTPCAFAPLGTVEIFNPLVTATAQQEQAWTVRASMLTPREGLAAAVVNGKIYALGGHTSGGGPVSSMEFYDPSANTWSDRAPMPGPRAGMAAAVIGTIVYVVGGDSAPSGGASIPLNTLLAYDAVGNSWTTKAPMLTARLAPAAAAVNGTLYVIGGDGSGSVEAYDPATDTWTVKATMPGGGTNVAATLNGLIYAVGDSPGTVKVYNPARDSWAVLGSLPSPQRGQFALAVLDGRLFAAGGMLDDQTAVGTLSANRPPETTWWSNNTAVGQINSGNDGRVNGLTVGTATISARLVGIDGAGATLTVATPVVPTITGSPATLRFAATKGSPGGALVSVTSAQVVSVTYTGATAPAWTASSNQPWLQITSGTGTGTGRFTATVSDPANTIAGSTSLTATITLSAPNVSLTTTVSVTLSVKLTTATDAPFGSFDTPIDGTSGVSGSIAVSGWAMDDVEVTRVEIWRDRVAGETTPVYAGPGLGNGKIYIADPVFVTGARPDIEAGYGTLPLANRAGWGYLLLTQGLWLQGNGQFKLYAFAYDRDGRSASLGSKTIDVSNSTATKPFGSIDTPAYGQTVTTSFWNFGWALTPTVTPTCAIPLAGVQVSIDSRPLVPVSYGDLRPDIAGAFPGFSNGAGAGGAYFIDTSTLANGTHIIGWFVVDDCNRAEGIGSRFFNVLNSTSTVAADPPASHVADGGDSVEAIEVRRGDLATIVEPAASGERVVPIAPTERVELVLPRPQSGEYAGYLVVNGERRALPLGSSLDAGAGIFYWQAAAGFFGAYDLEFVPPSGGVVRVRAVVGSSVQAAIDLPTSGPVASSFVVAGWAVDLAAASGTGVDTVHLWAYPVASGAPIFLGVAEYGDVRRDIGALFGKQFDRASYSLTAMLPSGTYDLVAYPHSTVIGGFGGAQIVRITVP